MRFSKFANVYEVVYADEIYYIIRHSITNKSFFMSNKEFNELINNLENSKEGDDIQILKANHLLVTNDYREENFIEHIKKAYNLNKFNLEIIYLLFNTNCNLRCKYCYVEESTNPNFKHNSLDEKQFEDLMNYLCKLLDYQKKINVNKNKLTFIYYGSEPLMSKDFFKRSLEIIQNKCDKLKIIPDFQITTNGTLFDEEIIDAIKKFNVGVSISLDGKKEVNDKMRVDLENKGTYNKIVNSIKLLNDEKIPFGISCTINKHNIDCLNESADHFIELGAKSVGFNMLLNARYTDIPSVSVEKSNDNLISASSRLNDLGIYEDRLRRKINAFNGVPRFKDCGGVGNQLVFFPNGDIGTCEAYLCNRKSVIGNIKNLNVEDIESSPIVKYWTERYPLNMKECLYCPSLGICGGGCPFNAETISKKDIYTRDKTFCVHTHKALQWLLKKSSEEKTNKKNPHITNISFMYSDKIF